MIRRNGGGGDNTADFPDPKELMRQRLVEPDSNQMSAATMMQQSQQQQQFMGGGMMGNGMEMQNQNNAGIDSSIMRSDNQLVEDILKEMGESPGALSQSNINSQAFDYAMDHSQVPAHKYVPPQEQQQYQMDKMADMGQQNASVFTPSGLMNQISFSLSGQNLKNKFSNSYRYPILVFVICFILGLPEFNRFLFSFFPKFLLESGQVSLSGVLLKAGIGAAIFILVGIFL